MGGISDIGYHTQATTSESFLRLETLREANDRVSNAIAELPIFRHDDLGDTLHSSSDGQKFETRIATINARHSPEYFGLKKGVVSDPLVANHVPVNAEIIGANEPKSHYVFDLLFNNTTDIQPDVHSTDTHGINEGNFALLHLFGYQFAPRYRDLPEKVRTSLYGFKHPSQYAADELLKPVRKINTSLIGDQRILQVCLPLRLTATPFPRIGPFLFDGLARLQELRFLHLAFCQPPLKAFRTLVKPPPLPMIATPSDPATQRPSTGSSHLIRCGRLSRRGRGITLIASPGVVTHVGLASEH
jgi:Tn3 transposase DDE domain